MGGVGRRRLGGRTGSLLLRLSRSEPFLAAESVPEYGWRGEGRRELESFVVFRLGVFPPRRNPLLSQNQLHGLCHPLLSSTRRVRRVHRVQAQDPSLPNLAQPPLPQTRPQALHLRPAQVGRQHTRPVRGSAFAERVGGEGGGGRVDGRGHER